MHRCRSRISESGLELSALPPADAAAAPLVGVLYHDESSERPLCRFSRLETCQITRGEIVSNSNFIPPLLFLALAFRVYWYSFSDFGRLTEVC